MLTDKQQLFCEEYLKDLNATQAAIRSGYSKDTAGAIGFENLTKPVIQDEINRLQSKRSERTAISADRVLKELARIAFYDPKKIMSWGPDGVMLTPSDDLDEDDAAMVSEITQTTTEHGGSMKIKLHDKISALDKLGKHLKLFSDAAQMNLNITRMGAIQVEGSVKEGKQQNTMTLTFNIGDEPPALPQEKKDG